MGIDHKVPFRSEEAIAEIAARCWAISSQHRPKTFDVVSFIDEWLIEKGIDAVVRTPGRKKGKLKLELFDRETVYDDPAYVEFSVEQENYVSLHVDREIWHLAKQGHSFPCEVLAHEIGHILLHDHYADNTFTTDARTKFFAGASKEDFAEWQAITFSKHVLAPTHVVREFDDVKILAAVANITEKFASERIEEARAIKEVLNQHYEGDACANCTHLTVVRQGCHTKCETCGHRKVL